MIRRAPKFYRMPAPTRLWLAFRAHKPAEQEGAMQPTFPIKPPPSAGPQLMFSDDTYLLQREAVALARLPVRPDRFPPRVRRAPRQYRAPILPSLGVAPSNDPSDVGVVLPLHDGTLAWFLHGAGFYESDEQNFDAFAFLRETPSGGRILVPLRDEKGRTRFPQRHGAGVAWPALVFEPWIRTGAHGAVIRVRPAAAWYLPARKKVVSPPAVWAPPNSPYGDPWTLKATQRAAEAREEFQFLATLHRRLYLSGRGGRHVVAPVAYFVLKGYPPPPPPLTTAPDALRRPYVDLRAKMTAMATTADRSGYVGYLLTTYGNGGALPQVQVSEFQIPDLLFQLWFALAGMHLSGVFHGDLSPSNIVVRWPAPHEWLDETARAVTYAVRTGRGADEGVYVTRYLNATAPELQIIDLGNSLQLSANTLDAATQMRTPLTTLTVRPPEHLFYGFPADSPYATPRFTDRSDTWAAALVSLQMGCSAGPANRVDPRRSFYEARAAAHRRAPILMWADANRIRGYIDATWLEDQKKLLATQYRSVVDADVLEKYTKHVYIWRCVPPAAFLGEFLSLDRLTVLAQANRNADKVLRQLKVAYGSRPRGTVEEAFHLWNVVLAFGTPRRQSPYARTPLGQLLRQYERDMSFSGPRDEVNISEPYYQTAGDKGMTANGWVFDMVPGMNRSRFRRGTTEFVPAVPPNRSGRIWNGVGWIPLDVFFSHRFFAYAGYESEQSLAWAAVLQRATRLEQFYVPRAGAPKPRSLTSEVVWELVSTDNGAALKKTGTLRVDPIPSTPPPSDAEVWARAQTGGILHDNTLYVPRPAQRLNPIVTDGTTELVVGDTQAAVRADTPTRGAFDAPLPAWTPMITRLDAQNNTSIEIMDLDTLTES